MRSRRRGELMSKNKNTKHGKSRLVTRMNLSKKRANTMSKLAISKGVGHEDTVGDLSAYLYKLFSKHHTKNEGVMFRIYNDFIFIFKRGKLITSWELPEHLKKRKFITEKGLRDKKPFTDSTDPDGQPAQPEIKKESKTTKVFLPDFEERVKRIRKLVNSRKFSTNEELDTEIKRVKKSHRARVEKIAYIAGIVRKFYREHPFEDSYEFAIKKLSYGIYTGNYCVYFDATKQQRTEQIELLKKISIDFFARKYWAEIDSQLWFLPMPNLEKDEVEKMFSKSVKPSENPQKYSGIQSNFSSILCSDKSDYKKMIIDYLPVIKSKKELLKYKEECMYYFAIGCNDVKINNYNTPINYNILKEEKIEENILKHISISGISQVRKRLNNIKASYKKYQIGPFASGILRGALRNGSNERMYLALRNRVCYLNAPLYKDDNGNIIYDEYCYKQWCLGTIDAFIKNAILRNKKVDFEGLRKIIKENKHESFKTFIIRERDVLERKKYIENEYSEYFIRFESFITSRIRNSLIVKTNLPYDWGRFR